jgi:hypothetical protein
MLSSRALLNEWHYADAVGLCTLLARIHRPLRKHALANMMRVASTGTPYNQPHEDNHTAAFNTTVAYVANHNYYTFNTVAY